MLGLTGGAIGQGLPCAVGAALACPGRRVIAFQADGSGLYTLQALWTMAREALDVTVVICANRAYRILQVELARAGVAEPGPKARALTQLGPPVIDWVAAARGFGVPGRRVETGEALADALARALAEPGPHLIEAVSRLSDDLEQSKALQMNPMIPRVRRLLVLPRSAGCLLPGQHPSWSVHLLLLAGRRARCPSC